MTSRLLPITVIIPIHNHEHYIRQCLSSIRDAQELPEEIILVDNASTDASVSAAQEIGLSNLSIIRNSVNVGATRARSQAIECARSNLIAFLDSDDFFGPNALRKALDALQTNDLDSSLFHVIRVSEDTSKILPFVDAPTRVISGIEAFALSLGGWGIHTCMLFKKDLYLKALRGFEYSGHADDEVLSRRMLLCADRISGSEGVYYYRTVPKEQISERIVSQVRTNLRALAMAAGVSDQMPDDAPIRAMRNVVTRNLFGLAFRAVRRQVSWSDFRELAGEYDGIKVRWRRSDAKFQAMDLLVRAAVKRAWRRKGCK